MVILDTNLLIDHLRQRRVGTHLDLLVKKYDGGEFGVSVVSVQELFAGRSSRTQEAAILKLLTLVKIWPYSQDIAKKAGEIERDIKKDADFADTAIAATCLVNHCSLATLNQKDFAGIEGLEIVES